MDYPVLYKYLKSKYLNRLLYQGEFRIGTLYDFKNQEKHGDEIGDKNEGELTETVRLAPGEQLVLTSENVPPAIARAFDIAPGITVNYSGTGQIISPVQSEDLFLFCATTEFNEDVMREFGCDACVVIKDPGSFFGKLNDAMRRYGVFQWVKDCIYMERTADYRRELNPAQIKHPAYQHQKEVRAAWKPHHPARKPFNVSSPAAAALCSIYWPR